jgi:hypothetical protein
MAAYGPPRLRTAVIADKPAYHGAETKRISETVYASCACEEPMVERTRRRHSPLKIAKREPEYIYHWNRIIGVLALLVLMIGLLGYGIHAWLTQSPLAETLPPQQETAPEATLEKDPAESPAPSPLTPAQTLVQPPASQAIPEEKDAEPVPRETTWGSTPEQQIPFAAAPAREATPGTDPAQEGPSAAAPRHESPLATGIAREPAETSGDAEPQATDHMPFAETDAESSTAAESSPAQAPGPSPSVKAEPESDPEPGQTTQAPATTRQDTSAGPARSQYISIASAALKRFSLAQSVLDREPIGELDDIAYNADGFTSVSAFSEVIGLNGEILHYRWLQEGAEVAVVRVDVGADRWRSHSTKRIDRGMEGRWRVELLDSRGTLLASIDFVF